MTPEYYYLLTGTLFRNPNSNDNLIEINQEFHHANLWEARKRAFNQYQNYIDVFLESLYVVYESHQSTEELLQNLNHPNISHNEPKEFDIVIDEVFGYFGDTDPLFR